MPIHYVPPHPEDLRALKQKLGYTGEQMAELFGLSGNNQWRKYTGGESPRPMSLPMLFLAGAMLDRTRTAEQIFDWCREVGAIVELSQREQS
ncbi:XRE family transcriptional regulator [Cupriavidus gilardii]|uniref:type II toxin-antitoxin system MqsA family antitoxin n=1 Tax=Cupriavidus gilardii TaxID=82541 RepID=UPI001EE59BA6|nr:type II toxin-antitoxin system MqsA family antitoxin [Cupriavidus gilardii]MCG5259725.1 type II toxin-antitoxin system MqsA family antitoxin [Cupriavidus gilardii]MDF9432556.1 XRE family transcriptional regulator [Cupriavidus gilardii]